MADYLTQFEGYSPKTFNFEFPPIDKGTILTIAKLKIKHEGEDDNTILFKLKNCPKEI